MGTGSKREKHVLVAMLFSLVIMLPDQLHAGQYNFVCGSCHGMPPLDSDSRNSDTGAIRGNHRTHVGGGAAPAACTPCHDAAGYATGHRDGQIRLQGNINSSPDGGQYLVNHVPVTFKNQTSIPSLGACSNVNCHFENGTSNWGAPNFNALSDCSSCHSIPRTTGSHPAHDSYYPWPDGCARCHPDYGSRLFFSHATSAGHRGITIRMSGQYSGDGLLFLPSQTTNPQKRFGACSNTYCHSDGQSPPTYAPPVQWGGDSTSCTACHGSATSSGSGGSVLSGRHAAHVNNPTYFGGGNSYHCTDCHASSVSSDTMIAGTARHANGFIDYSGLHAGSSARYNRDNKSCSNIYCHSDGAGQYLDPTAWNVASSPLSCNGCHRNTSGSHTSHTTGSPSIGCEACHNQTAQSGTLLRPGTTWHIDGARNVGIDPRYDGNGGGSNYFPATRTCSGITCHSNSKGMYQDSTWGTRLSCASCHPNLTGGHVRHSGGLNLAALPFYQYTANRSSGEDATVAASYGFGCANCHPVNPALHADGTIQVEINRVAGAGSLRFKNLSAAVLGSIGTNTVTCANVYCHGDGKTSRTATIAWGATSSAGDRCARCHGNSPSTGAHSSHEVGIHYDNIFQGYSGLLQPSGNPSVSSSHGDPLQSTTISCNLCHAETVSTSCNKKNTSCSSCHGADSDETGIARIGNLAKHVNGRVDVAFAPVTVISKAQVRPEAFAVYSAGGGYWTRNGNNYKNGPAAFDVAKVRLDTPSMWQAGNCANTACHMGRTVNWYGSLTCVDCHSSL